MTVARGFWWVGLVILLVFRGISKGISLAENYNVLKWKYLFPHEFVHQFKICEMNSFNQKKENIINLLLPKILPQLSSNYKNISF